MSLSILDVFNRYRLAGGEEYSVERMIGHLQQSHQVASCRFASHEWTGEKAPNEFSQAWRMFYNPASKRQFEKAVADHAPNVAVFHNIYPIGSPALYHSAKQLKLPVVQVLHNFRPFSVGGTLYSKGRLMPDALHGNYWPEVREGTWMGSPLRSGLMAVLLKLLHRSGWLESVKTWVAISDFMRERLIEAGAVHPDRIVTLRHGWDALPQAPDPQDAGYYLYLGRLIEEKGVLTLLDAWDALHARLGKNTPRLHIAGEGILAAQISQRARSNPFICALGKVGGETKADQLLRCRAVIAPSVWWEPLGLVTYEAYDHGKPVLAARSGGLTETVQQGQSGFLHEPGNAAALLQDVLTMESLSSAQRIHLGSHGRRWLVRENHPSVWLHRMEQILAEAVEAR